MTKKIMLLALAAVSAAVFALPATASAADEPLHLEPAPAGAQTIDSNGIARLGSEDGTTITCNGFSGTATFDETGAIGGTTGKMDLTFGPDCTENKLGTRCTSANHPSGAGNISTTTLPFHLVTLPGSLPGVLVTPNAGGSGNHFATFTCAGGLVTVNVTGNGVIGTITSPGCNGTDDEATIKFESTAHGKQKHLTIAGTETDYTLQKGSEMSAQDAHGTITLKEGGTPVLSKLVCT
jgi:opacity protein-like surface antigen